MGMIAQNSADAVESPKVRRHEMRVMSESDIHIFLEYARVTPYYALFYLALFTGMRRSELLALRWCDVDLLLCQISVSRTLHISVSRTLHKLHNRDIIIRETKTDKSRRLIVLSRSTVSVMREHRQRQETIKQSLGLNLTDANLIFSKYDGKPLLPDSVS